jgi:RHS repeat-associated protein
MHEDSAIGWSYNGARWYWPAVGRYTTPAITGIAAGLERYHHVDDPWVHRKPDGETVVTTVEDELELRTRDLVPVALRCHERVHDAAFLSLRDPSRDPALAPLRDVLSSNGPAVLDARVPLGADVGPWSLVREPALPVELTGPRIAW